MVDGDQFVDSMDNSRPWFDLWAALAAVAQGTESLRIAPYIAQIPMRDPATLARQVLTVDHISNGRVEVGLGLGRPVAASDLSLETLVGLIERLSHLEVPGQLAEQVPDRWQSHFRCALRASPSRSAR